MEESKLYLLNELITKSRGLWKNPYSDIANYTPLDQYGDVILADIDYQSDIIPFTCNDPFPEQVVNINVGDNKYYKYRYVNLKQTDNNFDIFYIDNTENWFDIIIENIEKIKNDGSIMVRLDFSQIYNKKNYDKIYLVSKAFKNTLILNSKLDDKYIWIVFKKKLPKSQTQVRNIKDRKYKKIPNDIVEIYSEYIDNILENNIELRKISSPIIPTRIITDICLY